MDGQYQCVFLPHSERESVWCQVHVPESKQNASCWFFTFSVYNLLLLYFSSRSRWGCQITDNGLYRISLAKCVSNLTSISLWGWTGITDRGVVQLVCCWNHLSRTQKCVGNKILMVKLDGTVRNTILQAICFA